MPAEATTTRGQRLPDFNLPNTLSAMQATSSADVMGSNGLLICYICNHCPYVRHLDQQMTEIGNSALAQGVGCVAISANDVDNYPDDSPERMTERGLELGMAFPYLYDESQQSARDLNIVCTPEFLLFDSDGTCVYHGRLCSSTPGNGRPVTGQELLTAIENLVNGQPQADVQYPSIGCSVKWK